MTQYATKTDVQMIVDKAVTDLSEIIAALAQNMDERFKQTASAVRVNRLEARLEKVENTNVAILNKMDLLVEITDGIAQQFETSDQENALRNAQIARLEHWAQQAGITINIPFVC